jgi:ribosomal protein S18 acetylase RimI-like enzyme
VLDVEHEAGAEVAVLVADVDRLAHPSAARSHTAVESPRDRQHGSEGCEGVLLSDRPTDAWWAVATGGAPTSDERFVLDPLGHEPARGDQQLGNGPQAGRPPRTAFGLAPGLGVVRAAVVDDHLHVSRLAVEPEARRAGVGTRLTAAAAVWGRANGARWAVLQVALQNTAARALYERLGAVEHHRYRYLVPPPVPPAS